MTGAPDSAGCRVPADLVNHPAHYNSSPARCKHGHPVECIDVVQWMTFNQGNATKYLWRMFDKGDPAENLRKAIEYCQFEIARLSEPDPQETFFTVEGA